MHKGEFPGCRSQVLESCALGFRGVVSPIRSLHGSLVRYCTTSTMLVQIPFRFLSDSSQGPLRFLSDSFPVFGFLVSGFLSF